MNRADTITISLVLTCHRDYLGYVKDSIASIVRQDHLTKKILVLDGVVTSELTDLNLHSWEIIEVKTANPNLNRNIALDSINSDFVVFFDADNVMSSDYIKNLLRLLNLNDKYITGLAYPNVQYCDENLSPTRLVVPALDGQDIIDPLYIDTSSCWNVNALKIVGGFDFTLNCLDDFDLCLRLSRLGWHIKASNLVVYMREHDLPRRSIVDKKTLNEDLWKIRTIGIVALFSGRLDVLDNWFEAMERLVLPANNHLYVLDNSGDDSFGLDLKHRLSQISNEALDGYTYIKHGIPANTGGAYHDAARHAHVANLYSLMYKNISQDLCLTFEEDVIPDDPNALRMLSDELPPGNDIGIVAAIYDSPEVPDHACASANLRFWGEAIPIESLINKITSVGFVGGGFTLYKRSLLKRPMIINYEIDPKGNPGTGEYMVGWDGNLCHHARQQGYRILINGKVKCKHNFRANHTFVDPSER